MSCWPLPTGSFRVCSLSESFIKLALCGKYASSWASESDRLNNTRCKFETVQIETSSDRLWIATKWYQGTWQLTGIREVGENPFPVHIFPTFTKPHSLLQSHTNGDSLRTPTCYLSCSRIDFWSSQTILLRSIKKSKGFIKNEKSNRIWKLTSDIFWDRKFSIFSISFFSFSYNF